MTKHNPENERIKRAYRLHLQHARGMSEASLDVSTAAIHRFEQSTDFRSFKQFRREQAIAFRRALDATKAARSGKPLTKATLSQILNCVRAFMLWLAEQPGYRSRIRYSDADYFSLSEKDERIAKTTNSKPVPTPEQIENVLQAAPRGTLIERRNRAIIAFTWLTGVRDGALVSLKLKHVSLSEELVNQDPREVRTKNSKHIRTIFFPVPGSAREIVQDWIAELRHQHLWGNDDPLFPATEVGHDSERGFQSSGLARRHWSNADTVRKVFAQAFDAAGLPAFNPHTFRNALVLLGEERCSTPEEFKAWSQNLGHESVLTTLTSYGTLPDHRQAAVIKSLRGTNRRNAVDSPEDIAERMAAILQSKLLTGSERPLPREAAIKA
jgi:integrase